MPVAYALSSSVIFPFSAFVLPITDTSNYMNLVGKHTENAIVRFFLQIFTLPYSVGTVVYAALLSYSSN